MEEDEQSKPERFIPPKHELEGVLRWMLSPETQFRDDKHRTESFCRTAWDYFTITGCMYGLSHRCDGSRSRANPRISTGVPAQ